MYTRKQPTHFSITLLKPKLKKKNFKTRGPHKFGVPKK